MRTTGLRRITNRSIVLPAAAAIIVAACGGEEQTSQSTGTTPVAPAVAVRASSGTTAAVERPDYSQVSYETAESTYRQQRYGEATEMFAAYVERKPDNPWGHYMLGLSSWKGGELDRARAALERSRELDPSHVKTLLNLGRVLLDQNRAGEAKERVQEALALDSTSSEVRRMVGRVHTALGMPDEATDAYRTALTLDPGDAWAMNNLALILIQQERYEDAIGPLARAVQLRPGAPVFQNNLGIALERTGHIGAAREAFRAAVAADGSYRKAQVSLARVEGLEDDPTMQPVQLGVLADAFEREVQRWREERMAIVIVPDVGLASVTDSLVSVPDSIPVPEIPVAEPK
jgi:Flp pilus assembly protein TadD